MQTTDEGNARVTSRLKRKSVPGEAIGERAGGKKKRVANGDNDNDRDAERMAPATVGYIAS